MYAIVLNWNGLQKTRRALSSLIASSSELNVILVDNGSANGEGAMLVREYPSVDVVALPENVGFARAVNVGAQRALACGAQSLLLFNNDAWLAGGSTLLGTLQSELDAYPSLAAVGPMVYNSDGSLQSCGYSYSLWFPVPRPLRPGGKDRNLFLSGSCLAIRASTFAELSGLDDDLFLYGDDVDFALRARRRGYAIRRLLDQKVYHERAASNPVGSSNYIYTALRSNLIVSGKHASVMQRPAALATNVAAALALGTLGVRAGNRKAFEAVWRAWRDYTLRRWGGYDGRALAPAPRPALAATGAG